jgi:GGDEF domain-containing protein
MDLIALQLNYASGEGRPESIDLTEQLQMLIRGIALHSIEGEPENFAGLQRRMAEIAATLHAGNSSDDLLVAISSTLRTLEEYNQKSASLFRAQREELRSMVSAMTETLQFVVSSSETSVKQLGFVESQLQRANGLEDLRQLKTYTAACLNLVRRESQRLQVETSEKVSALKTDVERLSVRLKIAALEGSEDPVTGLPGRAAAEQAMENRIADGKSCVAALLLMDRLASINGRFGNSVGDDVVVSCAQMLARKLSGATLYRWSGPGFVALFDPRVPAAEAEGRARLAAAQQLEKNIEADDRMIMVVVGVSCHLQHITPKMSASELFRGLDGFMIAGHG